MIGVPLLRLRGHYLAFATLALHLILLAFLFAQDRFTGGQDPGLGVLEPLEIFGWQVTSVLGAYAAAYCARVGSRVALTLVGAQPRRARARAAACRRSRRASGWRPRPA